MTVVYDINCHIVNTSFRYFSGVEGEARLRCYKKCVTVGLDGTNTLTEFRKSLGAEVRRGSSMTTINRIRLAELVARERALYV